jgi:hypothetical protein
VLPSFEPCERREGAVRDETSPSPSRRRKKVAIRCGEAWIYAMPWTSGLVEAALPHERKTLTTSSAFPRMPNSATLGHACASVSKALDVRQMPVLHSSGFLHRDRSLI